MRKLALGLVALAACGDDAPPPPPAAPPPQQAQQTKDSKEKMAPRVHAEDKVVCPVSDKPTSPTCQVDTPTCDPGLYCLQELDNTYHCEPCPERDSIRHEFKDRDFV